MTLAVKEPIAHACTLGKTWKKNDTSPINEKIVQTSKKQLLLTEHVVKVQEY